MRSRLIGALTVLLLATSCSGSDDGDSSADPETTSAEESVALRFTVDGVTGGGLVPAEFTCDGANETPTVRIESAPASVAELALVVDDPDAPTASPFVHWVVYGIDPDATTITDGDARSTSGVNDAGTDVWFGPCPPPGDGLHTYRWRLFGLSDALDLGAGLDGRVLEDAIAGSIVTEALLSAGYERAG